MINVEYKFNAFIDAAASDMVSALSRLVSIPSVRSESKPGCPFGENTVRVLNEMLSMAEKMGFTVNNVDNYVGTIDYYPDREPTLGIMCHLDVVPADGIGWNTPPYILTLSGGKLYGRGTMDDKGPAVAVLYAMYMLKQLGVKLKENVRLIVGTNEENGSGDIVYYRRKAKLPPRVFTPDATFPVINIEKGMIRGEFTREIVSEGEKSIVSLNAGTVVNAVPASAEAIVRGFDVAAVTAASEKAPQEVSYKVDQLDDAQVKITVTGVSAHASWPKSGKNALTALLVLLSNLKTDDATAKEFANITKVFSHGDVTGEKLGIVCSDEKSGALSFVHSVAKYDGKKYVGDFDIRFPLCESVDGIRTKIEKKVSKYGIDVKILSGVEPHEVDTDSPFIKELLDSYTAVTKKAGTCLAIGGGTYVHDIPGGVAFGAESRGESNNVHGANEHISLDKLKEITKIYATAVYRLCGK